MLCFSFSCWHSPSPLIPTGAFWKKRASLLSLQVPHPWSQACGAHTLPSHSLWPENFPMAQTQACLLFSGPCSVHSEIWGWCGPPPLTRCCRYHSSEGIGALCFFPPSLSSSLFPSLPFPAPPPHLQRVGTPGILTFHQPYFSGGCVNRSPCKPTPIHGSRGISSPGYCPHCAQTSILFVSEAALLAQGQGDFLRASPNVCRALQGHPAGASTFLVQGSLTGSS